MEIPADGILVESSEITADESAMTGLDFSYLIARRNYAHQKRYLFRVP